MNYMVGSIAGGVELPDYLRRWWILLRRRRREAER